MQFKQFLSKMKLVSEQVDNPGKHFSEYNRWRDSIEKLPEFHGFVVGKGSESHMTFAINKDHQYIGDFCRDSSMGAIYDTPTEHHDRDDISDHVQQYFVDTIKKYPEESDQAESVVYEETLNKPVRTPGGPKKFKVMVKDPSTGNVKTVRFGDPNMKIRKNEPERRKSFRARHKCDTAHDKTTARYWSCRNW